jgi:hypothetical protein
MMPVSLAIISQKEAWCWGKKYWTPSMTAPNVKRMAAIKTIRIS